MKRSHRITRHTLAAALLVVATLAAPSRGEDVSAPAILQWFESKWDVMNERSVDMFVAGYGRMWVPPPNKADSGGLSVGYDVFDRFHLGRPGDETLYGTEAEIKAFIDNAHRAGILVNTDFIANHNGFSDQSTPGFVAAGDYPGFVVTLPGDIDGDFHGAFEGGEQNFRLSGLIDIAQEKNHQFIRHPVDPGDPNNIPAGTFHDIPNPDNARYYPDQGLGGATVWHPGLNQNVTLYDFNTADPLQGDAVSENALGLVVRNIRWMIQEVGVDGFRYDAGRHFPFWVWDFLEQGEFLAKKQTLLDGSPQHVFSFVETGYDNNAFLQSFIQKDIDNNNLGQLGANRDALDFNLFGAIRANLSDNGLANDWRNIKDTSIDINDDGFANNGSQGVAFAQSHDEGGAHLSNVAYAYMLMRPGNAIVYFNGKQFGPEREFPQDGRGDALGGMFGDTVTKLVNLRNTHGRGNYLDRTPGADEKEMLIYEREKSALVVLSNRLDSGFDSRTVQTSFNPGTWLIELTGNAANATIDPFNDFPELLQVQGDGTVNLRVPRNVAADGTVHNTGYLIYGVSGPQGQMRLTNAAGSDITNVLAGSTPDFADTGDPDDDNDINNYNNGLTRLNDITVITDDTFKVRIETNAVNLLGIQRDADADGDFGVFRIDGGLDANGNGNVDHVTPGSVTYGFENFTDINQPGFFETSGDGLYEQTIDATQLSEGEHFITGRVFRHRNPGTGGDDGPAVYTDFRMGIYVDRLKPESVVESMQPFTAFPGDLDFFMRSTDQTADSVHLFLNEHEAVTDAELIARAQGGENQADRTDYDLFKRGFFGVGKGNNVFTLVTFERTGNVNVQRFVGQFIDGRGLGFGDVDHDNGWDADDVNLFESLLWSQFNGAPAFSAGGDEDGDGRIGTHDLLELRTEFEAVGVGGSILTLIDQARVRRGNVDLDTDTDQTDIDALFDAVDAADTAWLFDLDGSGVADAADVDTLVHDLLQTEYGDANFDGAVSLADLNTIGVNFGQAGGWAEGDFTGDGLISLVDLNAFGANFGFDNGLGAVGGAFGGPPGAPSAPIAAPAVPEPASLVLLTLGAAALRRRRG